MKVILLRDVPALGRARDVRDVSMGFARNFLLPRKFAIPATPAAFASTSARQAREEQKKSAAEAAYRAYADKLKNVTLTFKTKMGEKGKAFGSISAAHIREALKKERIEVDKNWIMLDAPIKTSGEKKILIKFPHGFIGEAKIIIEPEVNV